MKKILLLTMAIMSLGVGAAFAERVQCPIHDASSSYWDGSEWVDGVQLDIYQCSWGHKFAVRHR